MKDFTRDTTTATCIRSTVERHQAIIPYLLASHSLTGCDSVPNLHNIGKRKALSSVKNVPLIYIGKEESSMITWQKEKRSLPTAQPDLTHLKIGPCEVL